jgi:hypothetical protein
MPRSYNSARAAAAFVGTRHAAEFAAHVGAALCGRPVHPGRPRRSAPTGNLRWPILAGFWPAAFLLLTAQAPPADLASRELRLEIKQAEDRAGKRADELARRLEDLEFKADLILLLFGVSVAGIVPAYWLLIRRTKELVEERIGSLIESRPRALLALIDERDANLRLRRETPILVIADKLETEGLLRGSGFAKVKTRPPSANGAATPIDPGAVVVFNLDDGCSEQTASDLIIRNSLDCYLVYTSGRSNLRGSNVTFANSPVTLFSRLMELIEYKDALEREPRHP